jgi:surface polysaccharide O-acyltransferase-like enzyme
MAEKESNKQTQRLFYLDFLRAIAIVAVLILHFSADPVDRYGKISNTDWIAASIYNGLTRFCVPMFILLSGSLLLSPTKETSIKELFNKRLPKLVIPLVVWSIIYLFFQNYIHHTLSTITIPSALKAFYMGPLVFHFWFLYVMIVVYLLYPVINLFIKSATQSQVLYFLVLWFITNCIFGVIETAFEMPIGFDLNFFTGYSGYFVLGYYLTNYSFSAKALNCFYTGGAIAFIISVSGIILLYTCHFSHASGVVESDFSPEIPFAIAGLFLCIKNYPFNEKQQWWKKSVNQLSKESYGIYIVHVLIMRMLFDKSVLGIQFPGMNMAIIIPLQALATLVTSYGLVKVIRQIPLLKATV